MIAFMCLEIIQQIIHFLRTLIRILSLNPGEFRELSIRFRPDSVGPRLAALKIASNDPENPRRVVSLTGIGFDGSSATIQYDSTNSTQKITLNQPATFKFFHLQYFSGRFGNAILSPGGTIRLCEKYSLC